MDKVSLNDIMGGAAIEAFDHELQRLAENVLDPNTVPTATREIVLKVKIKPTSDRELGAVSLTCTAKLASSKPLDTRLFFAMQKGRAVAIEHDPKQLQVPLEAPVKLVAAGGKKDD